VGIAISNGDKVYGSGSIPVVGGKWSHKVATDLADGMYTVQVYGPGNVELAKGTVIIRTLSRPYPVVIPAR
jgi:hypothetical protein